MHLSVACGLIVVRHIQPSRSNLQDIQPVQHIDAETHLQPIAESLLVLLLLPSCLLHLCSQHLKLQEQAPAELDNFHPDSSGNHIPPLLLVPCSWLGKRHLGLGKDNVALSQVAFYLV